MVNARAVDNMVGIGYVTVEVGARIECHDPTRKLARHCRSLSPLATSSSMRADVRHAHTS